MIEVAIPGFGDLRLRHLVLDYNGTLALDGRILQEAAACMQALREQLQIHVITADTFGDVAMALKDVDCRLHIIGPDQQDTAKLEFVRALGRNGVVAVGNGRNDGLMLKESALGICVLQQEGAGAGALASADIVCRTIQDALDLLRHPLRLTATLRN